MARRPGRLRIDRLRKAVAALAVGLFALVLAVCRRGDTAPAPELTAARVIELHAASLMSLPGVVGVYEGRGHGGETVIRVMLAAKADSTLRRIPRRLGGYRVETEVSGPIEPMHR